MFDAQAFRSWPIVLAGAAGFAVLFALAAMMSELLLDGAFRITRSVVAIGLAAFFGYLMIAMMLLRCEQES